MSGKKNKKDCQSSEKDINQLPEIAERGETLLQQDKGTYQKNTSKEMKSTVNSIKRGGGTPQGPKNPSPVVNNRKIVDANNNGQAKKIQSNPFQPNCRKLINFPSKPAYFFGDKQSTAGQGFHPLDHFTQKPNFHQGQQIQNQIQSRIQQQQQQQQLPSQSQQVDIYSQQHKQHNFQMLIQGSVMYQPFGVSDQEKINNSPGQYPSPSFTKKSEVRKEEFVPIEAYKELLNKYENLSSRFDELKQNRIKLVETLKQKDEAIKQLEDLIIQKDNAIKFLKVENGISKKRIQELIKQNKLLKEQLTTIQNEERRDNHEQIMEMMFALRLHQQEEQQMQMAIQESSEENQNNPNFINIDNMTYELEEKNGNVCRGLPENVISSLPIMKFNQRLKGQLEKCTICMYEFEIEEEIKQLPCKHFYHVECVDSWLQQEKKCPVCKAEIDPNEQE